jgi:hypothetical protein
MDFLFWLCWTAEVGVVLWWLFTDLQLEYVEVNVYSVFSLIYLMIALLIHFQPGWESFSLLMVGLPAVPLTGLLLIVLLHAASGKKWN